jgi:glutamate---cysteine ligase / carboxylate-amine ligase
VTIDIAAARETFEGSVDLTVGIEEELAIVDPDTLELLDAYERLRDAAQADPVLKDSVAGELIASEIEIRSGRGEDFADAIAKQREARRRLFALADTHGVALGSTGTHPLSDYRDQRIIDTPHYRRLDNDLRYVAWRNNTWALQVHVGVQGADRAIRVCDRLRPILPLVLAVSANSPYLDGRDSGLHSARTQAFTRNFPRCGIPDAFGSWAAWAEYVDLLVRTNSIVEFTQMWWSVRPHHAFGTIEVRICDAQMTAGESDALAELLVACVARAAREVDAGEVPSTVPGRMIEENVWRALRYGLDGLLLDLEGPTVQEFPAQEVPDRLRAWTGAEVALPELNGAQRQRRLIEAGATPAEVYAECLRETRTTFYEQELTP